METKFYEFSQNNTGGSFVTNDKLCHRIFIEATTESEAVQKAEDLGCYWNGVNDGNDCPCCGDRWYASPDEIDLSRWQKDGYTVGVYDHYKNAEKLWFEKFGQYPRIEEPKWRTQYGSRKFEGKIFFNTVEEYAQYLADDYGWTTPDARIFYLNGTVSEVFKRALAGV